MRSRFQSFDDLADPSRCVARVSALRAELARRGLAGFVVPRSDEHQNEYVPPSARRLAWLTGFTGSAGTAVVLAARAAIFVDGRYALQVREQVDPTVLAPLSSDAHGLETWLREVLGPGDRLGFDPWLHTPDAVERLRRAATQAGAELVAVDANPVDAVWPDRPAAPCAPIRRRAEALAGQSTQAKLAELRAALTETDALVVSDPHTLAWMFNLRGGDVDHTPIALGYGLIPKHGRPTIYLDPRKVPHAVGASLTGDAALAEPDALMTDLDRLARAGTRIRLDEATAAEKLRAVVAEAGGTVEVGADPIAELRAIKTAAERDGARAAHLRDAVAIARFLHWFAENAPHGGVTEIAAAVALEGFRLESDALRDLAFTTISAFGPHAALPHYRPTTATDGPIGPGLYLVDSGAQYDDGTTDITRTLAVGQPTDEMRDRFTRVLKGHIAVARAVFPAGTPGAQIDALARTALWEAGLDFDHGTGHGVGSNLSVHEGPQEISKRSTLPLRAGMILSNEPGYYKAGAWGIRIENLVLVEERSVPQAERPMLGFETLTLAPIDRTLVQPALLTAIERAWLDAYHARVRTMVGPLLEAPVRRWLHEVTAPIGG